jgi:hypothetical protein
MASHGWNVTATARFRKVPTAFCNNTRSRFFCLALSRKQLKAAAIWPMTLIQNQCHCINRAIALWQLWQLATRMARGRSKHHLSLLHMEDCLAEVPLDLVPALRGVLRVPSLEQHVQVLQHLVDLVDLVVAFFDLPYGTGPFSSHIGLAQGEGSGGGGG